MKRRARRAPISGRSAPSVRARRAHPGTHPPPSIRPRPLQIPSSRPSVGTQSPEQVGHFRSPEVGHFRRPLTRRCWGGFRASARCRSETGAPAMPVGGPHRENWPALHVGGGVVGAGFALTRDAGRRPALQRCRSEAPTGRTGQRSKPRRPGAGIPRRTQKKPARWRVSRGAAIAAPRGVPADLGRGQVIVR